MATPPVELVAAGQLGEWLRACITAQRPLLVGLYYEPSQEHGTTYAVAIRGDEHDFSRTAVEAESFEVLVGCLRTAIDRHLLLPHTTQYGQIERMLKRHMPVMLTFVGSHLRGIAPFDVETIR